MYRNVGVLSWCGPSYYEKGGEVNILIKTRTFGQPVRYVDLVTP